MSLSRPNPFLYKWAETGLKTDVPDTTSDTAIGKANIQVGFPEVTMKSVLSGGVPPWGQDHNGILNRITTAIQWTQAGGIPTYNSDLRPKIGGYPVGAVLQSTRHNYLFYVNMKDGNALNPDDYSTPDRFWVNDATPGNYWAIMTTLSDDSDSISYYTPDFRIATKVVGAKSAVYVRPSYTGTLIDADNGNIPYLNIGDAVAAIPDGGTANIYFYYNDQFYLTKDNSSTLNDTNSAIDIGTRKLNFFPYGQGTYIEDAYTAITKAQSDLTPYVFDGLTRPTITIPIGYNSVTEQNTHGTFRGGYTSSISFNGFVFSVNSTSQFSNSQFSSPFNPNITLNFVGCIFNYVSNLPFLYGGWGGASSTLNFNRCYIDGGKFIGISDGFVTSLSIAESINDDGSKADTGLAGYNYITTNLQSYFKIKNSYYNFSMRIASYSKSGSSYTPNGYYPNGLELPQSLLSQMDFS